MGMHGYLLDELPIRCIAGPIGTGGIGGQNTLQIVQNQQDPSSLNGMQQPPQLVIQALRERLVFRVQHLQQRR